MVGTECISVFMNAGQNYPLLKVQQTNLYKCVLENGFSLLSKNGFMGLLHPESVYDDPNGQQLRKEMYQRLKYHFQFLNVFKLFAEVHHRLTFSINVYSAPKEIIGFINVNNILQPNSIEIFFSNNQHTDLAISLYDPNQDKFTWNVKGNNKRLVFITQNELLSISKVFEGNENYDSTKLITIHTQDILAVINKFYQWKFKLSSLNPKYNEGFHETEDLNKGIIKRLTTYPNIDNYELIYSGPHISVSSPIFKTPTIVCSENSHYDFIDLCSPELVDYSPRTNYIPTEKLANLLKEDNEIKSWINSYKIGFRKMLSLESERTLQPALLPPKTSHVNGIISLQLTDEKALLEILGLTSTMVFDFLIKTTVVRDKKLK
jgi:hypothetical protein